MGVATVCFARLLSGRWRLVESSRRVRRRCNVISWGSFGDRQKGT